VGRGGDGSGGGGGGELLSRMSAAGASPSGALRAPATGLAHHDEPLKIALNSLRPIHWQTWRGALLQFASVTESAVSVWLECEYTIVCCLVSSTFGGHGMKGLVSVKRHSKKATMDGIEPRPSFLGFSWASSCDAGLDGTSLHSGNFMRDGRQRKQQHSTNPRPHYGPGQSQFGSSEDAQGVTVRTAVLPSTRDDWTESPKVHYLQLHWDGKNRLAAAARLVDSPWRAHHMVATRSTDQRRRRIRAS